MLIYAFVFLAWVPHRIQDPNYYRKLDGTFDLNFILKNGRPTYDDDVVCAGDTSDGSKCCPAYCCDISPVAQLVNSSIPDVLGPAFVEAKTEDIQLKSPSGDFEKSGNFVLLLAKTLNEPIYGGGCHSM